MKNRITLFFMAFLGFFGTGRITDAQVANRLAEGAASAQKQLPAIDLELPAQTLTATFALG